MFTKTIDLTATKMELLFSDGRKEARFRPIIYLSADKKVLAVGEPPAEGAVAQAIRVFENEAVADSFALLEAMIRYGVRQVTGSWIIGSLTMRISVGADLRRELKGFTAAIFHQAATNAGAAKVIIV